MRRSGLMWVAGLVVGLAAGTPGYGAQPVPTSADRAVVREMDRDLMEVSVPGLEKLYAQHRYTVTQVTQWYLDRIARYDGTYRALLQVDAEGALRRAAVEDASPRDAKHGELWGVPILVKANTSVKGWVTSAGWKGYVGPGKELLTSRDAMVVERLRTAGAILLVQTKTPDFPANYTNITTAARHPP